MPTPVWERERAAGDEVPQTETEARVACIWCDILGIAAVAPEDSFFQLGGHSLLAARVVTQIRASFELEMSVRAIFEHRTLRAFAEHIDALGAETSSARPRSECRSGGGAVALPALDEPAAAAVLRSPQSGRLPLTTRVSRSRCLVRCVLARALETAVRTVVERHEALRTVFIQTGDIAEQVVLEQWDAG